MTPDEELKANLINDISSAEAKQTSFEASAGAASTKPELIKTVIRQKNKVVAEAETQEAERAINQTIEKLTEESGLLLDVEKEQFAADLRKKLNNIKLGLIDQAAQADLKMQKAQMKEREKAQMRQAIFSLTQSGMSMLGASGGGSAGTGGTQTAKPNAGYGSSGAPGYSAPNQAPVQQGTAGSPPARVNI